MNGQMPVPLENVPAIHRLAVRARARVQVRVRVQVRHAAQVVQVVQEAVCPTKHPTPQC